MDNNINFERCKKMIWDISSRLTSIMYSKNTTYSVVRLIFLKYITDNCLKADTGEKMMNYVRVQKMFAARDNEGGQNAVYPVLQMLDEEYKLNNILTSAINEYAKDLFGTDDSWGKKNSTLNRHKTIMATIAQYNLEETSNDMNLGKTLVECLNAAVDLKARDVISAAETVTPTSLAYLSKNILQVTKEDVYADFVAGAGLSTLNIVTDTNTKIITSEINAECAAVAAMLYIMAGYNDISITIENSLVNYESDYAVADKMFIDAPLNIKKIIEDKNLSSSYLAVEKTMNMLKENGMAVVVVPGSILFGMTKAQIEQRKKLLDNKWLKAVIALPACFYSTGIGVNLLVISKTNIDNILFINAANNSTAVFTEKERKINVLTEEGIESIVRIFENEETIIGLSRVCSINEIAETNYDLTPARYMVKKEITDTTTLDEIEAELAELYKKLGI